MALNSRILVNMPESGIVHDRFYGVMSTMHIYYDTELGERQRRDIMIKIPRIFYKGKN